jgi:hypothetical protein
MPDWELIEFPIRRRSIWIMVQRPLRFGWQRSAMPLVLGSLYLGFIKIRIGCAGHVADALVEQWKRL